MISFVPNCITSSRRTCGTFLSRRPGHPFSMAILEKRTFASHARNQNLGHSTFSLATLLTELFGQDCNRVYSSNYKFSGVHLV